MPKQFTTITILLTLLTFPLQALAYLDPGTGSYFFQILMAAIFSGLLLIKICFKNIKAYIIKIFYQKTRADGNAK